MQPTEANTQSDRRITRVRGKAVGSAGQQRARAPLMGGSTLVRQQTGTEIAGQPGATAHRGALLKQQVNADTIGRVNAAPPPLDVAVIRGLHVQLPRQPGAQTCRQAGTKGVEQFAADAAIRIDPQQGVDFGDRIVEQRHVLKPWSPN